MKASRKSTVAAVVGCALGAALVQGLHAQAKPPVYYVVEVETTRPDAYANEFAPQAQAIIKAAGGRFLAIGGAGATGAKAVTPEGDPPKRVVVMAWDNMDQVHSWWSNPSTSHCERSSISTQRFTPSPLKGNSPPLHV